MAVLVAVRNKAEAEKLTASQVHSLRSIFQEAHEQIEQGSGILHDEFWKQMAQSRARRKRRSG